MNELWEDDDEDLEPGNTQPIHRARKSGEAGSNLYLLTGLVLGLALGLLYAWVISPIKYSDIAPASLVSTDQDQYRKMIALAYGADQDLPRARERLKLVSSGDAQQALVAQAQRMLAEKKSAQEARALAVLAAALSQPLTLPGTPTEVGMTTPAAASLTTLEVPTAVQTPTLPAAPTAASLTAPPPAITLPVGGAPFSLKSKKEVCDGSIPSGQMQIQVNDPNGKPLPGIKIVVTWQDGEDTFFTGLAPQVNAGYADFSMKPATTYQVKVGQASDAAGDLQIGQCAGGWQLTFQESLNGG